MLPIIAAAEETDCMTVLHYGADFDTIAAVTQQGVEPITPQGWL